jgi:two-component system, LytTR family, sensor kinase
MKPWMKPSKLQLYSFLASMPVISILLNFILFDELFFRDVKYWLVSFPLIFVIGICSWRGHVIIGNWIKRSYPELKQTRKRVAILILCIIPFMSVSVCVIFIVYDFFGILGYKLSYDDLKMGLIVGFCVNIIFETLYEANFVMEKYKESVEEKEDMQELSIQSEFDALKSQVNPHFLFNCFNTLSSLIVTDRQRAEAFLNELSKVYRYLLRNNEEGVSTVDTEIKFIESYYQLLKTRHGDAVKLNIEIDKRYGPYLLPSLSLQLLVENVVKHNVLSKNKPLVIDIFTTAANRLVVNNNLQRRTVKVPSNKVGLDNIKAKYSLLKQPGFQVMEDEKNFTVVLPLIWKPVTAETDLKKSKAHI